MKIKQDMNKYLYPDFLQNNETYKKNVIFWDKIIKSLLVTEEQDFDGYVDTTDGFGNETFDGNPVYHLKVNRLNKAVRIIQEEPGTNEKVLFSAWLNQVDLSENTKTDELVITLELTNETAFLAIDAVSAWILRDLTPFRMKNYIKTLTIIRNLIFQHEEAGLVV
jgi:hypothetical protein